jgi:hypothetical protein
MTDNNKEDKNEKEDDDINKYGVNSNSSSSSIEIESDNNSIIPYNNRISLYHTNIIEKEFDIHIPLLNDFFNLNNNIINNNILKRIKNIRLFSSSLPGFTPKTYNSYIVIKHNDEIDLDVNKKM